MILAVDFDHVIHDPNNREPGYKMGKPIPGAPEALRKLHERGDILIIHTVRAYIDHEHVEKWLKYFKIPFEKVTATKPLADAYIDDKAIPFSTWHNVGLELENLRRLKETS